MIDTQRSVSQTAQSSGQIPSFHEDEMTSGGISCQALEPCTQRCASQDMSTVPPVEAPDLDSNHSDDDILLEERVKAVLKHFCGPVQDLDDGLKWWGDSYELVTEWIYIHTLERYFSPNFDSIQCLILSNSVRKVSDGCFANHDNLRCVKLGSSVECLGNEAFLGTRITVVFIPGAVTKIGNRCFFACKHLREVKFGPHSSLQYIGSEAFARTNLDNIEIPKSVIEIDDLCFSQSENLAHIRFKASTHIQRVGAGCLNGTKVKDIDVSNSLQTLCARSDTPLHAKE